MTMSGMCARCGATVQRSATNHRKWCSEKCRKAAYRAAKPRGKAPTKTKPSLVCSVCGTDLRRPAEMCGFCAIERNAA
jgi:endogenous inhibitor of DNA gyrase (YacG/DUF329 family)